MEVRSPPLITPEAAKQLAEESRQLRKEFARLLKRLHAIPSKERQAVCR